MTNHQLKTGFPEPVPAASQLTALPFAAAVAGHIENHHKPSFLRVVMHRVMSRDGAGYIQQVSPYLGSPQYEPARAGRILPVTTGVIGNAMKTKSVVRTRHYADVRKLLADLKADMKSTNDTRSIDDVAKSYLAIPMLSARDEVITILYADTHTPNVFAKDALVDDILGMCCGFCALIDHLSEHPLSQIKNYPMEPGVPVTDDPTVYPRLQEVLKRPVPHYQALRSFNFEANA